MRLRNLFLLNISLVLLFVLCQFAFATIVKGDNIVLIKDGNGYNFETNSSNATDYDIQLTSKSAIVGGCSSVLDLGFTVSSGARIRGFGANVNLDIQYTVPSVTGTWAGYSTVGFPICQDGDGLTLYTRGGNYTNIKITNIPSDEANVTISFQMQNSGSTTFRTAPTTGCYAHQTQADCETAQTNGQPCFWDWGLDTCKEDTNMQQGQAGGSGMRRVDCFEFDGNDKCSNITVCQWDAQTTQCFGDTSNWSENSQAGIACNNITDETFCNKIPILNTMCSWNSTAEVGTRCIVNNSKSKSDLTGLDISCEGIGTNDTLCNESIKTFFKPCQWSGTVCEFNQQGVFGTGGPGFFGDINTEESCESMGGSWLTETFKYSDSYGNQKTDTDSWCEMSFGGFSMGMEGCNEMCWACEDLAKASWGNTTQDAQSACENSTLGFCQFYADSNAFNGLGWCDMKKQMMFKGTGKSCDSDCASCDFLENASGKCNSSAKGCKWLRDPSGDFEWCEDKSAKYCGNDCFSCYSSSECTQYGKSTEGACEWDNNNYICKPSGFDGEICFDGMDNDNDNKIDCGDPDCGFDHFCGGKFLDANDCGQYLTSGDCSTAGCAWIQDEFDIKFGSAGHCGHASEQCWRFKENSTGCNSITGCTWKTVAGGTCDVNETAAQSCFNMDDTACNNSANPNCIWTSDGFGGQPYCNFVMFNCHGYHGDPASCAADGNCTWMIDPMSPEGGHCDPKCFGYTGAACVTSGAGLCQQQSGFCEPDTFMGNCPQYDGNMSGCNTNNLSCTWMSDANYHNSTGNATELGWCNGKMEFKMFAGMEGGPPVHLGMDETGEVDEPYIDIELFGVKDNPASFAFGVGVRSINDAAVCKDMVLSDFTSVGAGENTTKYYWYLDTDGNTTNGCTSDDGTQTGFEFKFKYIGEYKNDQVMESKVAYQCLSGSFGAAAIPLSNWKQKMCQMLGGGIISVDKEALKRFKNLYNDTQDMRIYVVSASNTTNESVPTDTIGPEYYTPGSFDFKMEDCFAPGQDLDGDGFDSDNDPDCQDFKKYGFIPIEEGPGCLDGKDNDNDGKTDCDDESCAYDSFFCGGSLAAIATDKTAPTIVLHKKNIFPDTLKVSITTNKPTNATLEYFGTNVTCGAASSIVATLIDADFNTYHGFMLDTTSLTSTYAMSANQTYAYKIGITDPSGNSAKSGCINFTTKAGDDENNCPKCNFTIAPKYDAASSVNTTNATGNLYMSIDLNGDGDWDIENDTMDYGTQIHYTQGKNSTIRYENLNSTEKWAITIKNVDIIEAMSSQTTSSTERSKPMGNMSNEFKYNTSGSDKFIGMGSDKFKRMMQNMGADQIELTVPMTGNHLWHCEEDNLTNCVDVSDQSGVSQIASDSVSSTWEVPISFGMGFSVYKTSTVSSGDSGSSGGGGSGSSSTSSGGGGILPEPEEDETKKFVYPKLVKGSFRKINVKNVEIIPITYVEFNVLNDLETVTFAVKSYRKQPKKVESAPANTEIYKYLGFEYTNLKQEDVDDIVIKFKVKKSWLQDKGAEHGEVKLRRYVTTWSTLKTTKESEDEEFVYYKATSPGLSYFSITVPKKEIEPTESEESDTTEPEPTGAAVREPEPKEKSPYMWVWYLVGGVVLLLVIYFIVKARQPEPVTTKRKKKKK